MTEANKDELLTHFQRYINEYWESLDKEGLLIDVLREHLNKEQILQLMEDLGIPDIK